MRCSSKGSKTGRLVDWPDVFVSGQWPLPGSLGKSTTLARFCDPKPARRRIVRGPRVANRIRRGSRAIFVQNTYQIRKPCSPRLHLGMAEGLRCWVLHTLLTSALHLQVDPPLDVRYAEPRLDRLRESCIGFADRALTRYRAKCSTANGIDARMRGLVSTRTVTRQR